MFEPQEEAMAAVSDKQVKELLDRTRRIETRLTGGLQFLGYETGSERPVFNNGIITIPTPATALRDIMAVVPADWPVEQEIEVHHQGAWIVSVMKPDA